VWIGAEALKGAVERLGEAPGRFTAAAMRRIEYDDQPQVHQRQAGAPGEQVVTFGAEA